MNDLFGQPVKPATKPVAGTFHTERRTQKTMLSGLDCAAGQLDLFDVDGCSKAAIRYAMTDGGFAVVDDAQRIGAFAYRTSDRWEQARKDPAGAAAKMVAEFWKGASSEMQESHYLRTCEHLA